SGILNSLFPEAEIKISGLVFKISKVITHFEFKLITLAPLSINSFARGFPKISD
ncbi:hypothetical protein SAMN00017477_1807, partial [Peptoniphilus asaccharolyticus DSM 20463]